MSHQLTFADSEFSTKRRQTRKEIFLSRMEQILPWQNMTAVIEPFYPKAGNGRRPYPLETMLRLYLLQNLYDLSDEATVAEAIDSRAFSEFCGVDSSNQIPDGDTLGRFRNLLIKNGLQEKLFAQVVAALMERGLILKKGTIVDSTIISAPSSTSWRLQLNDCIICTTALQTKMIVPALMINAFARESIEKTARFKLGNLYSGSSMMKKDLRYL